MSLKAHQIQKMNKNVNYNDSKVKCAFCKMEVSKLRRVGLYYKGDIIGVLYVCSKECHDKLINRGFETLIH